VRPVNRCRAHSLASIGRALPLKPIARSRGLADVSSDDVARVQHRNVGERGALVVFSDSYVKERRLCQFCGSLAPSRYSRVDSGSN
jgi:hypothetical protein